MMPALFVRSSKLSSQLNPADAAVKLRSIAVNEMAD
jgi:hypothetical protein